jgi:TfoX/Sxy family transcriptional regulator of competence genes
MSRALNPKLTKRIRDALPEGLEVEEKKMFGGIAFMINGKMCVTVGDNRIMCRIDPGLHQEVILQPGVSTVKMKGRDYIGWIYVDESVVPDKRKLSYWLKLALEFNKKIK